jgi:hypothetical protein
MLQVNQSKYSIVTGPSTCLLAFHKGLAGYLLCGTKQKSIEVGLRRFQTLHTLVATGSTWYKKSKIDQGGTAPFSNIAYPGSHR